MWGQQTRIESTAVHVAALHSCSRHVFSSLKTCCCKRRWVVCLLASSRCSPTSSKHVVAKVWAVHPAKPAVATHSGSTNLASHVTDHAGWMAQILVNMLLNTERCKSVSHSKNYRVCTTATCWVAISNWGNDSMVELRATTACWMWRVQQCTKL